MAAVPITFHAMVYPRDKSGPPYPATLVGFAEITGLHPGGGPILPPDQVPPVDPPLEIWPGPGDPDYPQLPDPILPPIDPPAASTQPLKPNAWNWYDGKGTYPTAGWFYVYVPGEGQPSPKAA